MTDTTQPLETRDDLPRLERPTRAHALRFARAMFARGERLDMQTLAQALGVGRTTLYRWVGDREQLLGEVLAGLSEIAWRQAAEEATGEGLERGLDTIRRFMQITSSFEPLGEFARREPGPALRVLLSEEGAVAQSLRDGFARVLEENLQRRVDPLVLDIMAQLATALEWAPIVICEAPAIDRAVHLMRTLLETHQGDGREPAGGAGR